MRSDDPLWMRMALQEAEQAVAAGEVPVGAVVVAGGVLLAAGHNRTLATCDPTAHAEIVALRAAAQRAGNHRLTASTVFVTVEPCIMCAGALVQARVLRVVFGCADPKGGALGSVYDIAADPRLNHGFEVTSGVEAAACQALMQQFFQARRGA